MLNFGFRLTNPWCRDWAVKDWSDSWQLTKNKFFELQVTLTKPKFLAFSVDFSFRGRDHAGLQLDCDLIFVYIGLNFFDHRHWNYEEDRWNTEEDDRLENEEWEKEQNARRD